MKFRRNALVVAGSVLCLATSALASSAAAEGNVPQLPPDCAYAIANYPTDVNRSLGCVAQIGKNVPPGLVSDPGVDPWDVAEVGTPDDLLVPGELHGLVIEGQDLIQPIAQVSDLTGPNTSNTYTCYYNKHNVFGGSSKGAPSAMTRGAQGRFYAGQDLRNTNPWPANEDEEANLHVYHGVGLGLGPAFTRVQVFGNYSYKGNVHMDPGFGPAGYGGNSATFKFYSKLAMRKVGTTDLLQNSHLLSTVSYNSPIPGNRQTFAKSGSELHDVTLIGGRKDVFFVTDLRANIATTTSPWSSSQTDFQFGPSDGLYLDAGKTQKWVFTLKKGYTLTDCGVS